MSEFTTLDGELQVRRAIDAMDQGRDKMRENNRDDRRKAVSGTRATTTNADPRAGTAEQLRKMPQGLRLLARMISRAHLRRQHLGPHRSGTESGGWWLNRSRNRWRRQHQQRRAFRPRWT